MKTALAFSVLLFTGPPLAAQDDPLKSPACGAALARLQDARAANGGAPAVQDLRSAAAAACLGSSSVPTRPARLLRPPVSVAPPQIEVPQRPAPLAAPMPPPPVAIERGPGPATCDAGGCWTGDGTHLRHVPAMPGPRGPCIAQGTALYCP